MRLIVDVIYQVLLVTNLEIDPLAISSKVEDILILSLGVLEMTGFLLADTSAVRSDEVLVNIVRNRKELGICDIDDLLSNDEVYSKCIILNRVLYSYGAGQINGRTFRFL